MQFNRAELDELEKREMQLTILSAVVVMVLAGGVAILMYPLVFVHDGGAKWNMRIAFFGFCALSLLFVGYLFDRYFTVRDLKNRLLEELNRNLQMRDQANVDVLHTIPGMEHFHHRLRTEFRRAVSQQTTISVLLVKVTLDDSSAETAAGKAVLGEAARCIARKIRPTDSIYQFAWGMFGVILPELSLAMSKEISSRVEEILHAVGTTNHFATQVLLYNYPTDVTSAQELEEIVAALLPGNQVLESEPDDTEGAPEAESH
ncbi:MAG: GGDEF domain-containing protein [Acidobacteriia bacterium]|nr:GGDEF domain-containing protein [Terriglobia bacterium]